MLVKNDFGSIVRLGRTDNFTPPPMDNVYSRWRRAELLLSTYRMTRGELAKHIGVTPRHASRILNELCLAIPLTEDEKQRWFVLGTVAEKCL